MFDCNAEVCDRNRIRFLKSMDELCREEPDIVLVCNSILSTEKVGREMPTQKHRPDTVFADALPVKQFPERLFDEDIISVSSAFMPHSIFEFRVFFYCVLVLYRLYLRTRLLVKSINRPQTSLIVDND